MKRINLKIALGLTVFVRLYKLCKTVRKYRQTKKDDLEDKSNPNVLNVRGGQEHVNLLMDEVGNKVGGASIILFSKNITAGCKRIFGDINVNPITIFTLVKTFLRISNEVERHTYNIVEGTLEIWRWQDPEVRDIPPGLAKLITSSIILLTMAYSLSVALYGPNVWGGEVIILWSTTICDYIGNAFIWLGQQIKVTNPYSYYPPSDSDVIDTTAEVVNEQQAIGTGNSQPRLLPGYTKTPVENTNQITMQNVDVPVPDGQPFFDNAETTAETTANSHESISPMNRNLESKKPGGNIIDMTRQSNKNIEPSQTWDAENSVRSNNKVVEPKIWSKDN